VISVLGIGDNTVDRYVDRGMMYPGGNAVNVAVHARRLGHDSAYLGCLGDDEAGILIYESLKAERVDVSRVRQMAGENAFCDIRLVDGDRVFGEFSEGMVDQLILEKEDLAYISQFDLVHTSVYSYLDDSVELMRPYAKFLSYDFSSEWDEDSLATVLPQLDFALISKASMDMRDNTELLRWAAAQGPKLVMITSGEQGAAVCDGGDIYYQTVSRIEHLVDTLGAGDAFAACFLTCYLETGAIENALQEAADYAAKACTQYGAFGHGQRYII